MREEILHFIWQHKAFYPLGLQTIEGQTIEIIHSGQPNYHDGPDFLMAKIKIDNTTWVGHVEIHLKTSDWFKHKHQQDRNYENVILHVVLQHDIVVEMPFPTLQLMGKIPPILLHRYQKLMNNQNPVLCSHYLPEIPNIIKQKWLERLMVERLQRKTGEIFQLLESSKQDWEMTFFRFLGRYLGGRQNKSAFELLFTTLHPKILLQHADNLHQLEALLLGQAGFLEEYTQDIYLTQLKEEYLFLKHKYQLIAIPKFMWKFKGIRPQAFPSLRLAQLAILIHKHFPILQKLLHHPSPAQIFNVNLTNIYWKEHYYPGKKSVQKNKSTGKDFGNMIVVNVVAPFLIAYGKIVGNEQFIEKSLHLLHNSPMEQNAIVRLFSLLQLPAENAAHSQSTIQLYENYCLKKKCVECAFGHRILKEEKTNFVCEENEIAWLAS
ncbi:MAG: DUF2851 family protein [Chitinophagales bacterium]|nr:DUF2851 family protein [Chitinophagales bacterium]